MLKSSVAIPLSGALAGFFLVGFPIPANAACDCDCLRADGYVATSQSVNNRAECASACAFASQVRGETLTPVAPTCGVVKLDAELVEVCSGKPIPGDRRTGEGVTHGTSSWNRRADACVDVPTEWKKVSVWCEVKTDTSPLFQCIGHETSSTCGGISYFRREGVVVKDADTVCIRSFNEENYETRYSQISIAPD